MLKGKKLLTFILSVLFVLSMGTLVACGGDGGECNFATEWSSDATNHWYACSDSGCNEVDQLAEHVWDNGTVKVAPTCLEAGSAEYKCKVCGYAKTETVAALDHAFATTYSTDEDGHWFACTREGCSAKGGYEAHTWNDGELLQEIVGTAKGEAIYACSVCGYDVKNYIVNVTLRDVYGELGGAFAENKVVTIRVNGPKVIPAVQERSAEYELVGYYTNPAYDTMVVDAEGNFVDCEYVENGRWIAEEGVELFAKWKKADKVYRIKFYVQALNSDKYIYQANETITTKGYIGEMTSAVAPEREGFTALPFEQVLIEEGGRTSVDIYYQRNVYTVSFVDNGAETAPVSQQVKYGGKVAPVANGEKDDFDFDGWYLDGEKFDFARDTVPAKNITLVAKYSIYLGNVGQYELYKGISNGAPVANSDFVANVGEIGNYEAIVIRANGADYTLVEGEDYTLENGVFTLKTETIKKGVYGDIAIKFVTGEDFYYVNASIATKFIRTVEDLENLMIYGNIDENLNYNGYFMMANNIEVNGVLANRVRGVDYSTVTYNLDKEVVENPGVDWHNSFLTEGFTGVFDGKGYTIFGLEVSYNEGALFGNVAKTATIKNLGIAEAKLNATSQCFGLMGRDFAGTLYNCYIDVALASATTVNELGPIARNVAGATISNTVIKYNAALTTGAKKLVYSYMINNWPGYATDMVKSEAVYVFSDANAIGGYAAANADGIYWANVSEINLYDYDEVVGMVRVDDYTYWNMAGDQPKFKTAGPADVSLGYSGETYQDVPYEVYADVVDGVATGNDFVVDLSNDLPDIDVSDVIAVTFVANTGSVTVEDFTLEAGILTVNGADLGPAIYGDVVVVLNTEDVNYRIPSFNIITKYIDSKADLENMMIYGGIDANLNYGGYFVMTDNVAVDGVLANRVSGVNYTDGAPSAPALNKGFTGTFDGQGYTISGVVVGKASGAIFGNVAYGATVKNVGIIATFTQVNENVQVVVLANQFAGALTNVYIDVKFAAGVSNAWYSPIAGQSTKAQITDVVVNIDSAAISGDASKLGAFGFMTNPWPAYWENVMTVKNTYVFKSSASTLLGAYAAHNGTKYYVSDLNNVKHYGYYETVSGISFTDNTYWNLSGGKPVFATAGLAPVFVDLDTTVQIYDKVEDGVAVANDFTLEVDVDEVKAVKVAGEEVEYTFNAGLLTISAAEFVAFAGAETAVVVETADVAYNYMGINVITKILENQADLENLMIYGGVDANLNYGGYFLLGNDIIVDGVLANRVSGTNYTAFNYQVSNMGYGFTGTLDGQGYTISGIIIDGTTGSLFGNVANTAVIKNLGVIATFKQVASGNNYVFGAEFAGELKNSYVEVDFAAGSGGANYSVMAAQATNAMFNDVLVKVNDSSRSGGDLTYAGWMINKWPNYWENNRTFSNFNVITTNNTLKFGYYGAMNGASYRHSSYNSCKVYDSNAIITDIVFADSTYWNLNGDQPKFATAGAVDKTVAYAGSTYQETPLYVYNTDNTTNDFVVDLGDIISENEIDVAGITSIDLIGQSGKKITVENSALQAGVLTVAASDFGVSIYGKVMVILNTDSVNYKISSFNVVTKVLTTPDEIVNIHQFGGATAGNYSYDGYYELGNNIDVAGMSITETYLKTAAQWEWSVDSWDQGFKGILDGKGYVISNIPAFSCYSPGIFGVVEATGVIKNTGFTGKLEVAGSNALYTAMVVLANRGTIENCYAEVTISAASGTNGTARAGVVGRNYGTITDLVVKYDASVVTTAAHIAAIGKINGDATTKAYAYYKHAAGLTPATYAGVTNLAWDDTTTEITLDDTTYWNFDADQPQFLSLGAADKAIAYTGSTYQTTPYTVYNADNSTNDFVVDLSDVIAANNIKVANISAIKVESEKVELELPVSALVDGVLTISGDQFGVSLYGDVAVGFISSTVNYKISSFKVITKVLTTADEVANIHAFGGATTSDYSYDGYYVLGNNIDLTGQTYASAVMRKENQWSWTANGYNVGFEGVLDGNGYTIYNIPAFYVNIPGIFGSIEQGAVIKNTGFMGKVTHFAGNSFRSAMLALANFGTIENCYVDITVDGTSGTNAAGRTGFVGNNNGTIKDVVVKFNADIMGVGNTVYTIASESAGTITNSYAYIKNANNLTLATYTGVTNKAYDDATVITVADGDFWNLTGQPIFLSAVDPANYTR